jgi:hypothetical protein
MQMTGMVDAVKATSGLTPAQVSVAPGDGGKVMLMFHLDCGCISGYAWICMNISVSVCVCVSDNKRVVIADTLSDSHERNWKDQVRPLVA